MTTVTRPDAAPPSPGAIALLRRSIDHHDRHRIAAELRGDARAVAERERTIAALREALREAGVTG